MQIIYELMVYYVKKHTKESEWFRQKHHVTKRIIKVFKVKSTEITFEMQCSMQDTYLIIIEERS